MIKLPIKECTQENGEFSREFSRVFRIPVLQSICTCTFLLAAFLLVFKCFQQSKNVHKYRSCQDRALRRLLLLNTFFSQYLGSCQVVPEILLKF